MNINQQIIKYLLKNPPNSEEDILRVKRKFCKTTKTANVPTNAELLSQLRKIKKLNHKIFSLEKILRKRQVRTLSGIAPIAVLTKPYPCPGNCAYCPNEKQMPKSYLSNEPAVMRAILCKFNPYQQVQMRLRALQNNGHPTDKLELIVMGGTWSYLPSKYQTWYITECFRAANDFSRTTKTQKAQKTPRTIKVQGRQKTLLIELHKQQKRNEKAKNRIIGLTLETRPDYINYQELTKMRKFGCTRIEIGVQHVDDKILKLNKRGHNVQTTIQATQLMRDFGFKITYHLMLNLPGSTPAKDFKMLQTIFSDPHFRPDQIKIYPCVVAKGALIYHWYKQGKWKAYSTKQLIDLLIKIKSICPPWVRIIRVIRDIPEESIIAGNKITNLRQLIVKKMDKHCQCIRCREAGRHESTKTQKAPRTIKVQGRQKTQKHLNIKTLQLIIRKYKTTSGTEYFLSFESKNKRVLYAFCRLHLPKLVIEQLNNQTIIPTNSAIIRELHTYGQSTPVGQRGDIQHTGLGKKLLNQAEKIAKQKGYKKIAVISGVGVRDYYRKMGYKLEKTYMTKAL